MQQAVEGAQTPYEVYCYQCRVTFPVGQKRCVHCGGRLGPRGEAPFRGPVVSGPVAAGGLRGRGTPGPPGDAEEEPSLALRRFGGLALWALIVVSALVSNLCSR